MFSLPLDFLYGLETWPLATHAKIYSKFTQCNALVNKLNAHNHTFFFNPW